MSQKFLVGVLHNNEVEWDFEEVEIQLLVNNIQACATSIQINMKDVVMVFKEYAVYKSVK